MERLYNIFWGREARREEFQFYKWTEMSSWYMGMKDSNQIAQYIHVWVCKDSFKMESKTTQAENRPSVD